MGYQQPPMAPPLNYITPKPAKPLPPSSIPPRGYRHARKPIPFPGVPQVPDSFNFPILNEMMTFTTAAPQSEHHRIQMMPKMTKEYNLQHQTNSQIFFHAITHPSKEITLPEQPKVETSTVFVPHTDQPFIPEVSYFSVNELENPPEIPQDQESY